MSSTAHSEADQASILFTNKPTSRAPGASSVSVPLRPAAALIAMIAFACSGFAQVAPAEKPADSPVALESTVVTGTATATVAAAQLAAVPGAIGLINNDENLRGKPLISQKTLFDLQPAVYAQGSGNSEGVKISIRGSGLGNPVTYNRGVNLLFDGLTFAGFAMSGHAVIFNENLGLDYTEVLVGSNGFDYQSLGLGGAINYVSKTGYNASRFQARVDAGSFGFVSAQLSSGQVVGNADYYASVVASRSDGFQVQSKKFVVRLISNFGYKISDTIDTRFFLRYGREKIENPGALTLTQLFANPNQAAANNLLGDNHSVNPWAFWLGNKTTFKLDADSKLFVGGSYDYVPYEIYSALPVGLGKNYTTFYDQSNITYWLGYERNWSKNSITKINLRGLYALQGDNYSRDDRTGANPTSGQNIRRRDTSGTSNVVLSASHVQQLADNLSLKTGVSAIHFKTVNEVIRVDSTVPIDNSAAASSGDNFNYVVGLNYDLHPDVQVFANVSRSIEQPTALSKSNSITNASSLDLKEQVGTTYEIGARARAGIFQGGISLYRTNLRDEFLTVVLNPNATPVTTISSNASPTVHQGVELSLDTTLWSAAGSVKATGSKLLFRQAYTHNDFHFKNDPVYGKNEIPSIPANIYQAELNYEDASGFYASANARFSSSYFADYKSTFKVPRYTIYGATVGYKPIKSSWDAYVTVNNIADKIYVATTRPNFNNAGTDSAALYTPGDPFSVYAGISFHF